MPKANESQVGGDHYRQMAIQPERFIYENGIGYHEGSAITYLCRWRRKGGVQDLEKAKHFIDLLIAHQAVASEPEQADKLSYGQIYDALYKQPTPEPDAPDPGPGWRLLQEGDRIGRHDQFWSSLFRWEITECEGLCFRGHGHGVYRTPIYHNPANLESAGEGHRFCLVSETESDATQWWFKFTGQWCREEMHKGAPLHSDLTYRTDKPLPTT